MESGIPKIFFQTSKALLDPSISEMIKYRLTEGWVYKHYRDADIVQFFLDYPDPEFPDIIRFFHTLKRGEHKADLFRYYHIYKIGGFFMDSDAMIYESIDRIVQDYTFVSVRCTMIPESLFQGTIGAEPGNPVMYQALKSFYTMDTNLLDSDYHYLCRDIYTIYTSYKGDMSKYKLYIELGGGKRIVDPMDSTLLFKHFWDNKIGIPNTLVTQKSYDSFIQTSSSNISDVSNLIYFCVFYNPDYFKLLELLLKTLRFFSKTNDFHLLVVTNKDFEPLVQDLSIKLTIHLKIKCIDFTTIFQAACARLYIFDYEHIDTYSKILYLDTDIIIKKDLAPVFLIDLEEKLYGIKSGTISSPSFGNQFFDFSKINGSISGINSGTLLFKNCQVLRDLFSRIRNHINIHVQNNRAIPYCMDQPFINYHAIKDGLYDTTYMNQHVSLYEDADCVENYETSSICHFSYPIGNFGHKYQRMIDFVIKLLHTEDPNKRIDGLIGRSYTWGSGYIKFTADGLSTEWGPGNYDILDANLRHIRVHWNSYFHILKINPALDSYICIRIWPRDFSLIEGTLVKSNPVVYIYGDSHAYLSFNNLALPHMQLFQYAITMHRIARDTSIVNFHASHLGYQNIFCFAYGEVDVRCHIGIQVQLGRDEVEICRSLITKYIHTIQTQITLYKAIILVGISPPADPADHTHQNAHPDGPLPFIGTNDERIRYTRLMNSILEDECKKSGYIYFNPYAYYTREDGCLNVDLSDGCIHIGKNQYFLDEFTKIYKGLK
jgi:hypothetical protein